MYIFQYQQHDERKYLNYCLTKEHLYQMYFVIQYPWLVVRSALTGIVLGQVPGL